MYGMGDSCCCFVYIVDGVLIHYNYDEKLLVSAKQAQLILLMNQ